MKSLLNLLAPLLLLTAACSTDLKNRPLEDVAKDWSMLVRASQVIPVYPLTEDLQPGDVLLVQVPVDRQQQVYEERGFLPLDNLIHRINPSRYPMFYERSFTVGPDDHVPKIWLTPKRGTEPWSLAPSASFPTYSFSVQSGGGFVLALPVQGVPIGLSLLGGGAAQGTITIADARTYGIDTASLYQDVLDWAEDHAEFLSHFGPTADRTNYLRVVNRVFLTGRLNVSLQSSRSGSGAAPGGALKPLEVMTTKDAEGERAAGAAYAENVQRLNTIIEGALQQAKVNGIEQLLPGGTVKVAAASAGNVSLVETFPRPLVFGYLGFDVPIGRDGALGPPIPTHALLMNEVAAVPASPSSILLSAAALRVAYETLKQRATAGATKARDLVTQLDTLEATVPDAYPTNLFAWPDVGTPLSVSQRAGETVLPRLRGKGFVVVTTYKGKLADSLDNLKTVQRDRTQKVQGFTERSPDAESFLAQQAAQHHDALRALQSALRQHQALLMRAREYAMSLQQEE